MVFDAHYVKTTLVFNQTASSAVQETAEMGLWWLPGGAGLTDATWNAALLDLAQQVNDAWQSHVPADDFGSSLAIKEVIATRYDTSLHTEFEEVYVDSTPWAGSGGSSLPWQVACVVGLYSYTPGTFILNARRRRGRVYLPAFAASMPADGARGALGGSQADSILTWFNAFIGQVAAHELAGSTEGSTPVVLSRMDQRGWAVTDLACDTVLDTQRRRTKSMTRSRHTLTFTV